MLHNARVVLAIKLAASAMLLFGVIFVFTTASNSEAYLFVRPASASQEANAQPAPNAEPNTYESVKDEFIKAMQNKDIDHLVEMMRLGKPNIMHYWKDYSFNNIKAEIIEDISTDDLIYYCIHMNVTKSGNLNKRVFQDGAQDVYIRIARDENNTYYVKSFMNALPPDVARQMGEE